MTLPQTFNKSASSCAQSSVSHPLRFGLRGNQMPTYGMGYWCGKMPHLLYYISSCGRELLLPIRPSIRASEYNLLFLKSLNFPPVAVWVKRKPDAPTTVWGIGRARCPTYCTSLPVRGSSYSRYARSIRAPEHKILFLKSLKIPRREMGLTGLSDNERQNQNKQYEDNSSLHKFGHILVLHILQIIFGFLIIGIKRKGGVEMRYGLLIALFPEIDNP